LGRIKPEAVYFTTVDGNRTGLICFDLENASDIPAIAEPFFQRVNAALDLFQVMTPTDVQAGLEDASKVGR
jgi:hypothetical protein